jgi:hypothetical protein
VPHAKLHMPRESLSRSPCLLALRHPPHVIYIAALPCAAHRIVSARSRRPSAPPRPPPTTTPSIRRRRYNTRPSRGPHGSHTKHTHMREQRASTIAQSSLLVRVLYFVAHGALLCVVRHCVCAAAVHEFARWRATEGGHVLCARVPHRPGCGRPWILVLQKVLVPPSTAHAHAHMLGRDAVRVLHLVQSHATHAHVSRIAHNATRCHTTTTYACTKCSCWRQRTLGMALDVTRAGDSAWGMV